jgi:putative ABC transport system ATP-binding protein
MSTTGDSEPVIACRDLTKVYRMGAIAIAALRGVDLALAAREIVVLLGPSGSGKSTLLHLLGGLDTPTSGDVRYRGERLQTDDEASLTRYRREHVGFVFQFYNLIASLTARENVGLVSDLSDDPLEPEDALALVGLGDRLDHFPAELSGGEQQRVAIARAIAKKPDLLLCDEPTGALDYRTGVVVLEVLERVHAELDTTIAIITHNAPIASIAHRVLTLSDGRIAQEEVNRERRSAREVRW